MTRPFYAVIGSPISGSLSPAMHTAEFRRRGLEVDYRPVEMTPDETATGLSRLVAAGARGLSVTMPLKEVVYELVDRLDESASRCRSVNTVVVADDGSLLGANTDGAGAVAALAAHGAVLAGSRCAVFGAGGAARAIVHALADAGAEEIVVVARDAGRAAASIAGCEVARVSDVDAARSATIVVNATPLGMEGVAPGSSPVEAAWHRSGSVVLDCVYRPLLTPFLADARRAGGVAVDGLWMLVHQAVGQQRWWFGVEAEAAVMRDAALVALDQR